VSPRQLARFPKAKGTWTIPAVVSGSRAIDSHGSGKKNQTRGFAMKNDLTTGEIAALFRISEQTVRELARRKILKKNGHTFPLADSLQNYLDHFRALATSRGGAEAIESAARDRARLAATKADSAAFEFERERGRWVPAADVETEWSKRFRNVRVGLLALTQRLSGLLPHLSRADLALIDSEVRQVLSDVADGKFD
jgi:phage terminase Nu1 subunit (DNA packaging protein)